MDVFGRVKVCLYGVTWDMGVADRTTGRIAEIVDRSQELRTALAANADGSDETATAEIPDGLAADLYTVQCEGFLESVRGWDGMEHDGQAVPFSLEAARDVMPDVKVEVFQAANLRRRDLQGKESGPGE
jgi:hypothetical protein